MLEPILCILITIAVVLGLAMAIVGSKKEEHSPLPSTQDPEIIRAVYYNTMRIEDLMNARAKEIAVQIVGKYLEALAHAQSLPIVVAIEGEASSQLIARAGDLLKTKGWEVCEVSGVQQNQVQVIPITPEEARRRRRRSRSRRYGRRVGGGRYWG